MFGHPDPSLLQACRALFGPEAPLSPEFLLTLKPSTVKTAFRKKAKETHPDLFTANDAATQRRQAEMFRIVNDAYDIMRKYCERRDREQKHAQARPHRKTHSRRPAAATKGATPTFHVDTAGWLYRGVVPERRLEIGRYLYYRGCIPYRALLQALSWQMRQRPALGVIAKQWGWLNDSTVRAILSFRGMPRLFGQRALSLGLLSSYQARILLAYQRTLQKKLGQYFVDRGLLTREDMEQLADDLNRHNKRFPVAPVAEWRAS